VFVVDQILIARFVLPLLQGLGEHALDQAYDWLDAQGVVLGRRGLARFWKSRRSRRGPGEFVRELGQYVQTHKDAAPALAAAAMREAVAGPATDEQFLGVILQFLMLLLETVEGLARPAVVPGFLTDTGHVAVIDVRTRKVGDRFDAPRIALIGTPRIVVAEQTVLAYEEQLWPRIWLVEATDEERADLEKLAEASNPTLGGDEALLDAIGGALLVTDITRCEVWVQRPNIIRAGGLIRVLIQGHGSGEEYSWPGTPDRMVAIYAALKAQVDARAKDDHEWQDAWLAILQGDSAQ
jgi:hypothetical protein